MPRATTQASITSQTITVEHIRFSSELSFAEVRRKFEGTVPKLNTGIAEALRSGDQQRAKIYEDNGPRLSIFEERDHGSLLQIWGDAVQYELGNPLTASKMTRHQLAAALYAPLRVVLFEDEQGRGILEYDRPSSFFSQYGDEGWGDQRWGDISTPLSKLFCAKLPSNGGEGCKRLRLHGCNRGDRRSDKPFATRQLMVGD